MRHETINHGYGGNIHTFASSAAEKGFRKTPRERVLDKIKDHAQELVGTAVVVAMIATTLFSGTEQKPMTPNIPEVIDKNTGHKRPGKQI